MKTFQFLPVFVWALLLATPDTSQAKPTESSLEASAIRVDGQDKQAVVEETLDRASEALKASGILISHKPATDAPSPSASAETFAQIVAGGLQLMERGRRVTREAAPFFGPDGSRLEGEILHVGGIAAYGFSEHGVGLLAPAGDGRLRL